MLVLTKAFLDSSTCTGSELLLPILQWRNVYVMEGGDQTFDFVKSTHCKGINKHVASPVMSKI